MRRNVETILGLVCCSTERYTFRYLSMGPSLFLFKEKYRAKVPLHWSFRKVAAGGGAASASTASVPHIFFYRQVPQHPHLKNSSEKQSGVNSELNPSRPWVLHGSDKIFCHQEHNRFGYDTIVRCPKFWCCTSESQHGLTWEECLKIIQPSLPAMSRDIFI